MNTENNRESAPSPPPSLWGRRFKHRIYFLVLLLAACSFVGAFFGGHYGATRNVMSYDGPRPAVGMQLPSAAEVIASIWGAIPGLALGALLGTFVRLLKVQMDVSPVKFGTMIGCIAGGVAGMIGGITHTWVNGTITGAVFAVLFGLLGISVADKKS